MSTSKSIFDHFTNQYSLSKTLRFELKPTSNTLELIAKNNVIVTDNEIDYLYKNEMKPMLDSLHRKFIADSLSEKIFENKELQNYHDLILGYKKHISQKNSDQKITKELFELIKKASSDLRIKVVKSYEKTGEVWKSNYSQKGIKIKDTGYKILTEKSVLDLLTHEFPDKKDIIQKFKGFTTYFTGFNQNRENYYSAEEKHTGIANRIVNENLPRYIDNYISFSQIIEKLPRLKNLKQKFDITSYNNMLSQVGIDQYNDVAGNVNKELNLFYQKNNVRLPKLKFLYKQIGSEKELFEILTIEDGKEWKKLKEMFDLQRLEFLANGGNVFLFKELKNSYDKLFLQEGRLSNKGEANFDLDKIYFNKPSINTISSNWFTNWKALADLLNIKFDKDTGEQKMRELSLKTIKSILQPITIKSDKFVELFKQTDREGNDRKIFFTDNAWTTFINIWKNEIDNNFDEIEKLESEFKKHSSLNFKRNNKSQVEYIKKCCDALLAILRMSKYHLPKDANLPREEEFYSVIDFINNDTNIVSYYNAFRNYLSQKPYSADKIKLNFKNGSLLGGWSDGQEQNKSGVILRNKKKYYLGILVSRSLFRTNKQDNKIYKTDSDDWQRLILSNLKFQTLAGKGFISKHKIAYSKVDPNKSTPLLQELIREDYLKKYPQLNEVANKKFTGKKEFDAEIKKSLELCFTMKFKKINHYELLKSEKEGKVYLFEITNKDLTNKKSIGADNLHTSYWRVLFSEDNLTLPKIALNGGAEVFYRKEQKDKLKKKKDKKGKEVLDAKRYGQDKFFFHVPITLNYGKPKNIKFKEKLSLAIANTNSNIIGIDRGEKHLLYYSVIDTKGKILEQGSLNKIKVGDRVIDFNEKLSKRAGDMMEARKNWETIGNIKNFKEGYLSQAVHEIYQLIIKYNAIVVLEDLNAEFKAKRGAKVEKSVYKKFELALAKKLNHLVLKNQKPEEKGGILNAYQLTPAIGAGDIAKFERAKQWGILFYVRANYTSTTDPITGWRKHIYVSNQATEADIKKEFETKIEIFYSQQHNAFGFKYKEEETKKEWELVAHPKLSRLAYDPKTKSSKITKLHEELEKLFQDIDKSKNINTQLFNKSGFKWKSLVYFWNLLNQIRNIDKSIEGHANDFIQSPVYPFFDSRDVITTNTLPENGDANGAFNIARKGLMLLERIKKNPLKYDQLIRDVEWDKWVQGLSRA